MFYRERKVDCGGYREVDIIPRTDEADHSYADTVEKLGWVNADRIQTNENGVEALCKYIMKNPREKNGGPPPAIW